MTRRLGRRRRLLVAAALLLVALAVAVVWALVAREASRPEVRRPGEAMADITDRLSRDVPAEAPVPLFVDVTAEAGLAGFRTFAGERSSQLPEDMGSGAAWGDFDGDGDEDLFLVAVGGRLDAPPESWAPSELYENSGDGTFRRVESFPETRLIGMGAAWGDADGDGDLDLAVSGYRALRLYRNLGDGRFARDPRFAEPDGFWAGIAWADFDRDGDLDLYVCGYVRYVPPAPGERRVGSQYGRAVAYTLNPASFEPEANLLLVNRGDGSFDEAALEWGVSNPAGRSLSALWHDFDDDGRIDLYVANDISDNALLLNRGETFADAALSARVADYRGAMGLAIGDRDRDGDDDLFVTHWLAQENALYDSRLRDGRALDPEGGLLGAGEGLPPLTFTDLSAPLGLGAISLPLVGWGTEMFDFDSDGWLDLVVANGSTLEEEQGGAKRLVPQRAHLLWSARGARFHDLASLVPDFAAPRVGRGLAVADYDGDGDLDLLLVQLDGGVTLWRNDTAQGRSLELRLRHRLPQGGFGRGEGATAVAWLGGAPLRRSATGVSYLSQSTRTLHFGLGAAAGVDRLEVRWPDGEVTHHGPLAAGELWELEQGADAPRRVRSLSADAASGAAAGRSREDVLAFWKAHRAGMDALKREGDCARAIEHFRIALSFDASHEDARYYLAHCLWAEGERTAALAELDTMRRQAPMSLRAHRQWAAFAAAAATRENELEAAAAAAERALAVNGEDTGGLLLIGEIALLRGRLEEAQERFALACRTNPRAVDGLFLGAFVAWRQGDAQAARALLAQARAARGEDWKPQGATAEGDVRTSIQRHETPLAVFWQRWDGEVEDLDAAFAALGAELEARRGRGST